MAGPPRAIRIGVIGGGQVFERLHLPAIRRSDACQLAAVAEPAPPRREWLASELPDIPRTADPGELLSRDDLDAVLVLTPPATHADLAVRGLQTGRAVFVEKPLAATPREAIAVCEAARVAGRPVQVGFNRRFRRTFRDLKHHAERENVAGLHYLFRADTGTWRAGRSSADRRSDLSHLLQDVASHQLDLLPWLRGTPIAEVRARPRDAADALELEIEVRFADGGSARVQAVHGPGYAERLEAGFAGRTIIAYPGGLVDGSSWPGPAERWIGRAVTMLDLARARLGGGPTLTGRSVDLQLAAFVSRVRGEAADPAAANSEDGLRAVQATAACEESLHRDGAWIALET